ncbi:hypothetical protein [Aquimarina aggregata]|uniref:hypothetical protein n=1 Tax=Aquimarina aggregata TaxID=1642818 RepID=UPI00248F50F3|nr:hypothetical protein [Aquimarina aggregata]
MEIKFLISVPNGNFGRGGQNVAPNAIIEIEEEKRFANIDVPDVGEILTGGFYQNKPIYRNLIIPGDGQLLRPPFPTGYNSGLRMSDIDAYIKTEVRKESPVLGDPLGGGFHSLADVFGSKKILYADNGIFFEGSDTDGIIELGANYMFLIEYTKKGRTIPILRVGSLRPDRQNADNP